MWVWKNRHEIDIEEWDLFLSNSNEPFVEFNSWYLDICCRNWGAFFNLENNSRIPIPFIKNLFSIKSVTRPPYIQRIKIIHSLIPSETEIHSLFKSIESRFSCGLLNWDYYFEGSKIRANYIAERNVNLYSQSQNRNLSKSIKNNLHFKIISKSDELFQWLNSNDEKYIYERDFNNSLFKDLVNKLLLEDKAKIILALDENNRIHAGAIFTISDSRIVFFLSFNSKIGKKNGAIVGIIHYVQSNIMQTHQILDLEGSDIPGVALFYEGFGAIKTSYFELTWNNNLLCRIIFQLKRVFAKI
ncbi:MAG: hypothetical protein ABI851_01840 [Saprospiraceae bacterium]